jgi:PiT family inorganic phosphate transporter
LVAAVLGAGLATAGFAHVDNGVIIKVVLALALSPILGFAAALIAMTAIYWIFRRWTPTTVTTVFSKLQILSTAFLSYSHGKNDAQNAMGIMALAWAVYYSGGQGVEVLLWMKVTRLEPVTGFTADMCAASVIELASNMGLPVSTTHTTSTAIIGVGATKRLSAVRWGVTRSILWAWLITYPFCAALGWTLSKVLNTVL